MSKKRQKPAFARWKDIIDPFSAVIIALCGVIYVIAINIDAFELLIDFTRDHEDWELDEIFSLLIIGSVGFLIITVRYLFSLKHELTRRIAAERKVHHMAFYDDITNMPNRALCRKLLDEAIEHARLNQDIVAVLFIDLDNFKFINDSFGHHNGDRVLLETSLRMLGQIRKGTLARVSGDEFIAVLDGIRELDNAGQVAERLLGCFSDPFYIQGNQVFLSCSIGIAVFPADGEDADEIIRHADTAMYQAKLFGKNAYEYFSAEMNDAMLRKLSLATRLRYALQKEEFDLYYQPQFDTRNHTFIGVEALLRWNDPKFGPVSPAEFIPVAEESGLIVSIGAWVLRSACMQAKTWQDDGLPPVKMAVNLSGRQLWGEGYIELVKQVLEETGLDPKYLQLELTETAVMRDPEDAKDKLEKLRSLGLSIALDDFGTGYSSMSYLKQLNVSTLKIDRSFIDGLPEDNDNASIVEAIISVAQALELEVIAEGVETKQQVNFLRENRCFNAQGYLFARPLPEQEVNTLMRRYADDRISDISQYSKAKRLKKID